MSIVKERLIGAVTAMPEVEAEKFWKMVEQRAFAIEEEEPTEEEMAIYTAYKNGDPEYQPFITHDELLKELGI